VRQSDGRYRAEHRVRMEEALGRPLAASEIVHHRNGRKTDNVPKNFKLTSFREHSREHWRQRRKEQLRDQLQLFEERQERLF
jgi:hypothetical protein